MLRLASTQLYLRGYLPSGLPVLSLVPRPPWPEERARRAADGAANTTRLFSMSVRDNMGHEGRSRPRLYSQERVGPQETGVATSGAHELASVV